LGCSAIGEKIKNNNNNNAKGVVTPGIIGPTGTISKSLRQYLSNLSGKHDINELKKLGHCTHT
jgi:hypothetical protein